MPSGGTEPLLYPLFFFIVIDHPGELHRIRDQQARGARGVELDEAVAALVEVETAQGCGVGRFGRRAGAGMRVPGTRACEESPVCLSSTRAGRGVDIRTPARASTNTMDRVIEILLLWHQQDDRLARSSSWRRPGGSRIESGTPRSSSRPAIPSGRQGQATA